MHTGFTAPCSIALRVNVLFSLPYEIVVLYIIPVHPIHPLTLYCRPLNRKRKTHTIAFNINLLARNIEIGSLTRS